MTALPSEAEINAALADYERQLLGEHGWMMHRYAAHLHRLFGHDPEMRAVRWDFISDPNPDVEELNRRAWTAPRPEAMPERFATIVAHYEALEADAAAHPQDYSPPGPGWPHANPRKPRPRSPGMGWVIDRAYEEQAHG